MVEKAIKIMVEKVKVRSVFQFLLKRGKLKRRFLGVQEINPRVRTASPWPFFSEFLGDYKTRRYPFLHEVLGVEHHQQKRQRNLYLSPIKAGRLSISS